MSWSPHVPCGLSTLSPFKNHKSSKSCSLKWVRSLRHSLNIWFQEWACYMVLANQILHKPELRQRLKSRCIYPDWHCQAPWCSHTWNLTHCFLDSQVTHPYKLLYELGQFYLNGILFLIFHRVLTYMAEIDCAASMGSINLLCHVALHIENLSTIFVLEFLLTVILIVFSSPQNFVPVRIYFNKYFN